jgi:hypothetical protein
MNSNRDGLHLCFVSLKILQAWRRLALAQPGFVGHDLPAAGKFLGPKQAVSFAAHDGRAVLLASAERDLLIVVVEMEKGVLFIADVAYLGLPAEFAERRSVDLGGVG